jgi:hypothetical protein
MTALSILFAWMTIAAAGVMALSALDRAAARGDFEDDLTSLPTEDAFLRKRMRAASLGHDHGGRRWSRPGEDGL